MTTQIQLTDTQRHILEHAADHPEGLVTNPAFPDTSRAVRELK